MHVGDFSYDILVQLPCLSMLTDVFNAFLLPFRKGVESRQPWWSYRGLFQAFLNLQNCQRLNCPDDVYLCLS